MGKFCTRCGRPLAEGEICNCQATANAQNQLNNPMEGQQEAQQNQQAPQYQQQAQQSYQQTQQAVSSHMTKTIGTFLNMIKRPITTGRQLVASNETGVAITFIVIQALLSGFFALAVMSKIGGTIETLVSSLVGEYLDAGIKFPYARIFILTALTSAVLSLLLALLLLVGNMIIKNAVTYVQMLNCVAVRSAWLSLLTLVALIVYVLNPVAGICTYVLEGIWGIIAILLVLPKENEHMDDKVSLILLVIMFAFCLVTVFVMIKIVAPNYLPDAVKMGLDEFKSEYSNIENWF